MNTEAYNYFAHQLQILLPPLRDIKACGTDGEQAPLKMHFQMLYMSIVLSTSATT